jgi:2-oxoglutarate ferredoxin oxidoreductase subunit beta
MRSLLLSLASEPVLSEAEGAFPVFYQNDRPTKNALEKEWIDSTKEKLGQPSDLQLLQKTFDRMK